MKSLRSFTRWSVHFLASKRYPTSNVFERHQLLVHRSTAAVYSWKCENEIHLKHVAHPHESTKAASIREGNKRNDLNKVFDTRKYIMFNVEGTEHRHEPCL